MKAIDRINIVTSIDVMPLYEYQCSGCKKVYEVMQKFSDAPLAGCPECHAPVSKLVSLSSFALKGSGWYVTDYKKAAGNSSSPLKSTASENDSKGSSSNSKESTSTGEPQSSSSGSTEPAAKTPLSPSAAATP